MFQNNRDLADLLSVLKVEAYSENFPKPEGIKVNKLCIDSRNIEEGDLFIAVPGFEHDGHQYLEDAAKRGAVAAIVEEINSNLTMPQIKVENSRLAQADLAAEFYGQPSKELKLCGITGSNGKTTTSLMYRKIITTAGYTCGLIGTVAYEAGDEQVTSAMTTPDSIDLQSYFRRMIKNNIEYAVMEVSSIGISQYRPKNTHYKVCAFINLGREHLDYHKSIENYFATKASLFYDLDPEAIAVLNYDDIYVSTLLNNLDNPIISFGLSTDADVSAQNIDLSSGFAEFDLQVKNQCLALLDFEHSKAKSATQCCKIRLRVPGFHSVYNALAAISSALAMGIDLETCIKGIEAYAGVERRFQEVYSADYRIFDDHFANSKNIEMTLETLKQMTYRNLILLYAIRGKRGVMVNRENIQMLANFLPDLRIKRFIASLSEDVVGHYDEVQPEELAVFQEEMAKTEQEYSLTNTLAEAVEKGLAEAEKGDIILLAGCQGMDAGARIALQSLAAAQPEKSEAILKVLEDRVCGW